MIRLFSWGLGLGLIWSLYWAGTGYWMQSSVAQWFDTQEARGWQADYADLSLGGFPMRHVTTITAPALADPATGTAWRTQAVTLDGRAIWPGHVTMAFADAPQLFSYFDQTVVLNAEDMIADLRLKPGLALELEETALTSGAWALTLEDELLARANTLEVSTTQQDEPTVYAIDARAQAFTPGASVREVARLSRTLPKAFDAFELQAVITWDKPWDRSALETARPQPRHVDLRLADAKWGALRVLAAGEFSVDENGVPDGVITIKAENWRDMLSIAETAGVLPTQAAGPLERTLNLLEGLSGNPNALDIQLNLRGGAIALGPIPLGPAPRFILR